MESFSSPRGDEMMGGIQAAQMLGDYQLIEELGQGGMGVVWKARHSVLNRVVALKLVRGGCLPGEAAAARFRREAEAAARLRHPNIVPIHEIGECDEQLFLAMEIAEGGTLEDLLKVRSLTPESAAILMAKVARGVHHAHEKGVMHRDIKPGNILIDADGEPMVCDFGLARIMDEASQLTMTSDMLGTPAYLSPEQAAGARELTPLTDVYSLGAVLYELLAGEPPFSGNTFPVLVRKVAEDNPARLVSHCKGVRIPSDLVTICAKAMEKVPKARYATALEFAEDLERWIRGEPIMARRVAGVERLWKWIKRKPVIASLWLIITVLLVVVAVVATVLSLRVERQRDAAQSLADASRNRLARQLSLSAQYLIEQHDWLRGLPALAEAIDIGTGNPRLDKVNRIRFGVLLRSAPQLRNAWFDGEPIFRTDCNLAGTRLLIATRRKIEVWNVESGERIGEPYVPGGEILDAALDSAGGQWVVIEVDPGRCVVWRPNDGVVRDVGKGNVYVPSDARMLREGVFVLYSGNTWEVQAGMRDERVSGPFQADSPIDWAVALPSLQRVIACDTNRVLHLWDVSTGKDVVPPIPLGGTARGIVFNGYNSYTRTASLHRSRETWLLNCVSGEVKAHQERVPDIPQSFGWDQNGDWVYLGRNDNGLVLRDAATNALRWPAYHGAIGFRGCFAPDVQLVATQSWIGSARVWRTSDGAAVTPFIWQAATPGSCILTPNGKWLMTRGDEPAARLWSLRPENGATAMPDRLRDATHLFFVGNPERLAGAAADGRVVLWNLGDSPTKALEFRFPEELKWAAAADAGKLIFTAGSTTAMAWDASTGRPFGHPFHAPSPVIHAVADPSCTAFALVIKGGDIIVWDAASGVQRCRIEAGAHRVALSRDGRVLLALGDKSARTWDAHAGTPISAPVEEIDGSPFAAFSPDGHRIVQWSDSTRAGPSNARVWDAATGRVVLTLPAHWLGVRAVAWSPDGTRIATGGGDQAVQVCDSRTGEIVVPPMRHFQKASQLGFSADGLLLWALVAGEVIVRDAVAGEVVIPRMHSLRGVSAVAAGSAGTTLATVGKDDLPLIWDISPEMRKPDELRAIAGLLSGYTLVNGTGALAPLRLAEIREKWEIARKLLPTWKAPLAPKPRSQSSP